MTLEQQIGLLEKEVIQLWTVLRLIGEVENE
jgi:hypothetical protein